MHVKDIPDIHNLVFFADWCRVSIVFQFPDGSYGNFLKFENWLEMAVWGTANNYSCVGHVAVDGGIVDRLQDFRR